MLDLLNIFFDNMMPVLAIAGVGFYLRCRFAINPAMISRMKSGVSSLGLAFILQAVLPIALLTIILAYEFETDQDLALNLIMVTTLISPLTLSVIIYMLQNGII